MPPPNYPLVISPKKMHDFAATSQTVLLTESTLLPNSGGGHLEEAVPATGPQALGHGNTSSQGARPQQVVNAGHDLFRVLLLAPG